MKLLTLLRSIVVTLLFPFTVILIGPVAILGHYILDSRRFDDAVIGFWARLCCRMSGVEVVVLGRDQIPQSGCLFLFNHTSFFDVFALAGYVPQIRFGAKAELFKIPIFSHAMQAVGTLPIARNNREEVFKVYEEAKRRFAQGEQFALSPEGGRFYGAELAPFKAGPFVFAMSAGVPVVPVVITGAYEALPKGAFLFNKDHWNHKVYIRILAPVETKAFTEEQRRDLQQIVYGQMNAVWLESQQKS